MSLIENQTCFFTLFYKITTLNTLMIQTISKCRNINQIFLAAFLMVSAAWKYFPAAYIGIFILLLFVRVSSNAQCAHDNKKPTIIKTTKNSTLQTICSDSFSLTTILHLSQPPTAHWHRGMFHTSRNVMIMMWSRWRTSHSLLTTRSPLLSHTDV